MNPARAQRNAFWYAIALYLQIANALDKVCKYTTPHFVEECHFMICKYYDVLIEALVSEFGNPDKVCGEFLSLCP